VVVKGLDLEGCRREYWVLDVKWDLRGAILLGALAGTIQQSQTLILVV